MLRPPIPSFTQTPNRRFNPGGQTNIRNSFDLKAATLSPNRRLKRRLSNVESENRVVKLPNINKPSTNSYTHKSLPLPETDFKITIQIMENHGNKDTISCSEIDILNRDKIALPVISISSSDPEEPQSSLRKLVDGEIIKESVEKAWSHPWSLDGSGSYKITLQLSTFDEPKYIRVWNTRAFTDSAIKTIKITIEDHEDQLIEVPIDFGSVVLLKMDKLKPKTTRQIVLDSYRLTDDRGVLPIPLISYIEIIPLSTFSQNETHVGLNSIEIFNTEGSSMGSEAIEDIQIHGSVSLTSPFKLLKDKKRTVKVDDMWLAPLKTSEIRIEVKFRRPTQVAMIRIWNLNAPEMAGRFGISRAKVCTVNGTMWVGKLNKAWGAVSHILEGVTDIWLVDGQRLRMNGSIENLITSRAGPEEASETSDEDQA